MIVLKKGDYAREKSGTTVMYISKIIKDHALCKWHEKGLKIKLFHTKDLVKVPPPARVVRLINKWW